jgi:phage gp45-like
MRTLLCVFSLIIVIVYAQQHVYAQEQLEKKNERIDAKGTKLDGAGSAEAPTSRMMEHKGVKMEIKDGRLVRVDTNKIETPEKKGVKMEMKDGRLVRVDTNKGETSEKKGVKMEMKEGRLVRVDTNKGETPKKIKGMKSEHKQKIFERASQTPVK